MTRCICAGTGFLYSPGPSGETHECHACAPVVIDEREAAEAVEALAVAAMRDWRGLCVVGSLLALAVLA
jgi:hypothetical protein